MTSKELIKKRHADIKAKLMAIELPNGVSSFIFQDVAQALNISAQTARNYKMGMIKDGYLAEAIYKELKRIVR